MKRRRWLIFTPHHGSSIISIRKSERERGWCFSFSIFLPFMHFILSTKIEIARFLFLTQFFPFTQKLNATFRCCSHHLRLLLHPPMSAIIIPTLLRRHPFERRTRNFFCLKTIIIIIMMTIALLP